MNNLKTKKIFIISGSPKFDWDFLKQIKTSYLDHHDIYAVDKGLEICDNLKLKVNKIIGDFDSLDPKILEYYPEESIIKLPKNKDKSDTEIAIDLAIENGYQEIILINATGSRIDHFLFNILILFKSPNRIKILSSNGTIFAVESKKKHKIYLEKNSIFSIIPLNNCFGVSLHGCKYPLLNQKLGLSTLTLSNIAIDTISLYIEKGSLLFYTEQHFLS